MIIHHRELKRTTNTGQLAIRALVNSELRVRGQKEEPTDLRDLLTPDYRSVLFYPSADALELNSAFIADDPRPIQLFVPDGNWRQASKVSTRQPELRNIPRVKFGNRNESTDHLRAEHMPEGMATLQAIAHAIEIIEGAEAAAQLNELYRIKLERTLQGRRGGSS